MAYEYGSIDLGIKNPFKFEGIVHAISGIVVSSLGITALFSVQGKVQSGNQIEGWIALSIGLVLTLFGLFALGRGLFQVTRFFVGRSVPASLAQNLSKSAGQNTERRVAYDDKIIEQMVVGRKNLTYTEPTGWLGRMVHTIMPKMLFLPYPVRSLTQRIISGVIYTALAFICYGLAWFSSTTGLTDISKKPVLDWLALILAVYILVLWFRQRKPLKRNRQEQMVETGVFGIVSMIVLSIFTPLGLVYLHTKVTPLPPIPLNAGLYVVIITAIACVAAVVTLLLALQRMRMGEPKTEISEFRDNWQESVHPQEIFINFENIIMANRRYKEIPNRVYRDYDARLIEEGSNDKGNFSGGMIQETQPIYKDLPASKKFKVVRQIGTILGQTFRIVAAIFLFFAIDKIPSMLQNPFDLVDIVFYPLLFWLFGTIIVNNTHVFWAEMHFESLLVYFQCQGTYSESKISTGAAIHDSTRSENVVVRSSITLCVISTRLVSTTFAGSGAQNLEFDRYVLEMHKADVERESIVTELKEYLGNRQTIANVNNADYDSASSIYQINEQTRVNANLDPRSEEFPAQIQTDNLQLSIDDDLESPADSA